MGTQNQNLADELIQLYEIDIDMRNRNINEGTAYDPSVDEASQSRLMEIVESEGWPTISKVGSKASNAAWLLIQHAPSLEFKEKCLALMNKLPTDEVNPVNIAMLEDRVLMFRGEPQIYGTQFQGIGKNMKVYEIKDPEHVDERRASVGLDTFAEGERRVREMYKNA
jgi:hypothetical protein